MAGSIETQSLSDVRAHPRSRSIKTIHLLPGLVEGVETRYYLQKENTSFSPARNPNRGQVFLFLRGTGEAQIGRAVYSFGEIAALCAPRAGRITLRANTQPIEYLEILVNLRQDEVTSLRAQVPWFILYSQCEPYGEAIKSPKTLSRTIVPPGAIPRFCMGSVETLGPDTVGAHSHPILEQLFFGLPGNTCVVTADEAEAVLGEGMLLHIPLGSTHGARVSEGSRLHYVWMDFFRDAKDLTYIQEQHSPIKSRPRRDI